MQSINTAHAVIEREPSPVAGVRNAAEHTHPDRIAGIALRVVAWCAALLLLSFYMAPGTIVAQVSHLERIYGLTTGVFTQTATVGTVLFAAAVALTYMWRPRRSGASGAMLALLAVYLAAYGYTALSPVVNTETHSVCTLILLSTAFGLLAARLCDRPTWIIAAVCAAAGIEAAYAVYAHTHGQHIFHSGNIARAGGTFDQPNYLYFVALCAIPLAVSLVMSNRPATTYAASIALAVLLSALFLSASRGGVIAVCAGLFWIIRRYAPPKAILAALVLMVTACALVFGVRSGGRENAASTGRSNDSRVAVWRRGVTVFENNWAAGVGVGGLEIPIRAEVNGVIVTVPMSDPKNIALYWLDEFGIAGAVLLVGFGAAIAASLRGRRSPVAASIGASWIAILCAGLFDTPLGTPLTLAGNAIFGALLGATILIGNEPDSPAPLLQKAAKENRMETR